MKRRIVLPVIRAVLADDVDDRRERAVRIVKVGESVGQARAEVQQRAGRTPGHSGVAVCRAGRDAFEQREDAPHAVDAIERRDEVHFRRAGVREAGIDAARDERADERFRASRDRDGRAAGHFPTPITAFTSRNSSKPNSPHSRPLPDCL